MPALVALGVSIFIAITTELMPVGLLLLLADDFDKSVSQVGIIVTVYATMVAVLSVPLTILTKRFERKTVLLATLAAFTLSSIVVCISPYFWLVAVGRALGGAAHALFFAVAIGYPARLLRPSDLGKGMAIVTAGVSFGFVLGVPAATALGVAFSWRVSFGIVAAVAVVLTLVVWRWLPAVPNVMPSGFSNKSANAQASKQLSPTERWNRAVPFISVLVVNLAVFMAHYSAYTYVNAMLERVGVAKDYVSLVLLVFGGAGLIGLAVVGRFLDVRPRAALLATLGVFIVGLVGFAFADNNLWLALTFALLWTAAFGGAPPFFSAGGVRTAVVSPDMTGAWVNSTSNIGISVGAIIGGWVVAGAGLEYLPLLSAGLFAITAVIVWFSRRGFPSFPPAAKVTEVL